MDESEILRWCQWWIRDSGLRPLTNDRLVGLVRAHTGNRFIRQASSGDWELRPELAKQLLTASNSLIAFDRVSDSWRTLTPDQALIRRSDDHERQQRRASWRGRPLRGRDETGS